MRRIAALLAVIAVVGACGSLKDEASQAASQPAHELLYVATATGMSVVDASTDSLVASLPVGTLMADRSRYWTVETGDRTTVRGLDPATGTEQLSFMVDGRWSPPSVPASYGPAPSGLSANGGWMVLVGPTTRTQATGATAVNRFAVIDLAHRKLDRMVTANGSLSFDAVSDDGQNLYVIEHLVPAPHYAVRVATAYTSELQPGILGQIKAPGLEMSGLYHASVPVSGGWLLSLYSSPTAGPFIHALNTTQLYAQCILNMPDVPVALRPAWSMVLDPKHPRLYAVNAAGGVVSEIDTAALKVLRSNVDLTPAAATLANAPLHPAAISPDATRIYAAGEHGILVIYTGDLSVRSHYLQDRSIDSIVVSEDGQRLYVASAGTITKVEARTGKPLGALTSATHALGIVALGSH
jgi:DNA-binding beta-propeller fold protein YncE